MWGGTAVDPEHVLNEQVASTAFHNLESACICYSGKPPERGLMALARWVNVELPVSAVVNEAAAYRRRLNV